MGRARDLANILSSSGNVALDSELALTLITPTSIDATGGSGSILSSGAVSFTSASAISLNGVFTSTYTDYLIKCNLTLSGSTTARFRMRLAGTDATGSNYTTQYLYGNGATAGAGNTTETIGYLAVVDSSGRTTVDFNLYNPNLAVNTFSNSKFTTNAMSVGMCGVSHGVATAYDSITILPGTGTITGSLSIYGYRK